MSGGVDSSAAAYLMKEEGYQCVGVTIKLFDGGERAPGQKTCCSLEDVEDARSAAYRLGMPYYVFNYKEAFEQKVIKKFADSYVCGKTPNPCIDCNRYLKFDALLSRAGVLGMDCLATGHYARIVFDRERGRYLLKKGMDETKDQSYVLFRLTQEQLSKIRFPLGNYRKSQIREIARSQGFENADKEESQDICFVPGGDYASFIERYTGKSFPEGDFITIDGKILGKHRGIIRYTEGQRRGLGISSAEPLYVCGRRPESNQVVVGPEEALLTRTVYLEDVNLISAEEIGKPIRCGVKIRYRQPEQWAVAEPLGKEGLKITFDVPQRAPAPGQAAVLYDGDTVIGGGSICLEGRR